MAPRNTITHYEDFAGIDLKSSDLTGDPAQYKELQNFQFSKQRSLRGRRGCQVVGQAGAFTGCHTFSYFDSVTGATQQELLAFNDYLWRLTTAQLTVTRVAGSTNWNYKMTLDPVTATFKFVLNQGGSALLTVDVGTGLEQEKQFSAGGVYPINHLVAAIDGLANFTCALIPGQAVTDGAQTGVVSLTVLSGHTVGVGDIIWFWDYATAKLVWRRAVTPTATTIPLLTDGFPAVNVLDRQSIGLGGTPAATIPVNDAYSSTADVQLIPYQYWAPVRHNTTANKIAPFKTSWDNRNSPDWKPNSCVNAGNCCYIGTYNLGAAADRTGTTGGFYKYDGNRLYRGGLPQAYFEFVSGSASGTALHEWLVTWEYTDHQGNIWEGPASAPENTGGFGTMPPDYTWAIKNLTDALPVVGYGFASAPGGQSGAPTQTGLTVTAGHTLTTGDTVKFGDASNNYHLRLLTATTATTVTWGANSPVTIAFATQISKVPTDPYPPPGVNNAGGLVSGNQSGAGTQTGIAVSSSFGLYVGDKVTFYDHVSRTIVTRTLTAQTAFTISWASTTAVDVRDQEPISVGLLWRLYRTQDHGLSYYLVTSRPNNPFTASTLYTDTALDAELGVEYDAPDFGYEHDITPAANFLTIHQGLIVAAGDSNAPNTVYYSDPSGLEYFPIASNSFDVPSNVTGPITGLGSDTADRLAVFKPSAYYDVPGDLATGAFSVSGVREGDYGIASHASIKKVNGYLVGVGRMGFVSIRAGESFATIGRATNAAVQQNRNVRIGQAFAIDDFTRSQYRCYIPGVLNASFSAAKEQLFCYDFETEQDLFFNWKYASGCAPTGGMALLKENTNFAGNVDSVFVPYHLNRESGVNPGHFFREVFTATPTQNYADNHQAIQYVIRSTPQHLALPKRDKTWLRLVLWSFYSRYELDEFTPWSAVVKTFRNFQETTEHTSTVIPFLSTAEFEKNLNLLDGQARAMGLCIETNTIGQCPHLTGWEFVLSMPYDEEDIRK